MVMPTDRSGRRVLSFTLGLSAVFDLTGAAIFRVVRPRMPEPPPIGSRPDPFRSAMDTIMAAHREVMMRTQNNKTGVTLAAWPTAIAAQGPGGNPIRWRGSPGCRCTAPTGPISP